MPRSATRLRVLAPATAVLALGLVAGGVVHAAAPGSRPVAVPVVDAASASAELSTTRHADDVAPAAVPAPVSVPQAAPGPDAVAAVSSAVPPPPPPPPVEVVVPVSRGGQAASRSSTRSAPAPASGGAAAPASGGASTGGGIASGVNAQRAANGLPALSSSGCAQGYAQSWAEHLASVGSISHQSISAVLNGCGAMAAGENVAVAGSPSEMVSLWMASSGHRANILDPSFTHTGAVAVQGADGRWYGVQVFLGL